MPYNIIKTSKGKYKVRYKKNGKMHTVPGASKSKAKAKKRIAAIEISKHMHESEIVNEYNIILPSEENVFKGKVFTDDNADEESVNSFFRQNNIDLTWEQITMAWDYYMNNEDIHKGEHLEGTNLTYVGTENHEEEQHQEHVMFKVGGCNLTLEIVNVNGSFKEFFLSDESKEPNEADDESVEEGLMFEALFKQIIG